MDFLFGLGLSIPLIFYTFVFLFLNKLLPQDQPFMTMGIMVMGDILLCAIYYYIGLEFIQNQSLFSKGIGLSFMLSTFIRVISIIVDNRKLFTS
jgi:thiol:disulfide interchange protein